MRLIVGLGNPGRRYQATPHNIGFEVVEELAARNGLKWRQARAIDAQFADGEISGVPCALLLPTTYMNASGEAVAPLVRGENLDTASDMLVAVDDTALPLGRLRLREAGTSGGHRGLDSLIARLGNHRFPRLRCGVSLDEGPPGGDLADYVLAKWPKSALDEVDAMRMRAADVIEEWIVGDIADIMSRANRADP